MGWGGKLLAYSLLKQMQEGVLWNESIFTPKFSHSQHVGSCGPGLGNALWETRAVLLQTILWSL